MANERIWRLNSLLIWKETTAWTEASTFVSIPLTSMWYIKPVVEYTENDSWYGRIEDMTEKTLAKKMSETAIEWIVRSKTFWHLLTATFWQSSSPTLVETGVYKHNFTVLNNNNHKTYSIVSDWIAQELSLYNVLDKLSIKAEVWNTLSFTGAFKWKFWATTTWKTVSYVTENPFKVCWMSVKFANDIAWLTGASETKVTTLNFEIAKNVMEVMEAWSCEPTSLHNQQFWITGDMELIYRAVDTLKWYNWNGTNQAMRITITWTSLIWATKYEELSFDFAKLNFDEWDVSNWLNDLQTQNIWFTWLYGLSDSSMLTWYIQNAQSAQY